MATIDVCDKCGTQDPERFGKRERGWIEVEVIDRRMCAPGITVGVNFLYCRECARELHLLPTRGSYVH